MTSLVIVDDQDLVRVGLRTILEAQHGYELSNDYADGLSAVAGVLRSPPDVVLMDIHMPGIDGIEATRRIREVLPAATTQILILTTFEHDENVIRALRAGANGFLSKGSTPGEIVAGIREVTEGGGAFSRVAAGVLLKHLREQPVAPSRDEVKIKLFEALTPRERDVVINVAAGLSNEEIAVLSRVSPLTVKTQVNRAMNKVGARDRAQLVAFAHQAGLAR